MIRMNKKTWSLLAVSLIFVGTVVALGGLLAFFEYQAENRAAKQSNFYLEAIQVPPQIISYEDVLSEPQPTTTSNTTTQDIPTKTLVPTLDSDETESPAIIADPEPLPPAVPNAGSEPSSPLSVAEDNTNVEPTLNEEEVEVSPSVSWTDINTKARAATVNILCTAKNSGSLAPLSGSGVMIDPRGVILTNAHVAQYFVLRDLVVQNTLSCVIRTGSPAKAQYEAELIYLPEVWAAENADTVTKQISLGNGQHDFALLRISGTTDSSGTLPTTFPYLEASVTEKSLVESDPVLLSAYPAGFLGGILTQKDLYAVSAPTSITQLFTFADGPIELISLDPTVVAQGGSSGGAVVDKNGELIGIIVTSTMADNTADRILRAITLHHVDLSFLEQTKKSLSEYLEPSLLKIRTEFASTTLPTLEEYYTEAVR